MPRTKKEENKKSKLKVVKGGKNKDTTHKKKFDEPTFYKKYPWVVEGSVEQMAPGSKVDGITVAHGRVCKIKCQETGKLRTINVQDAFQTKYCEEVQKRKQLERSNERRKKKTNLRKRSKTG